MTHQTLNKRLYTLGNKESNGGRTSDADAGATGAAQKIVDTTLRPRKVTASFPGGGHWVRKSISSDSHRRAGAIHRKRRPLRSAGGHLEPLEPRQLLSTTY